MAAKRWSTTLGGLWALDTNWTTTAHATALDDAVITGPDVSVNQVITGPGSAAATTFLGASTLDGAFAFNTLNVGTAAAAGNLTVAAGATAYTNSATVLYGPLTVTGANARLTVSGALTLGGRRTSNGFDSPSLSTLRGAAIQAGSLVLLPSIVVAGATTYTTGLPLIDVDATSSIEIGNAGNPSPGRITVDIGNTITGAGSLANGGRGIIDNGAIRAEGGELTVSEGVTGLGVMQIGANATLNLTAQQASTVPISFVGAGAALHTNPATSVVGTPFNANGVISGFVQGDVITMYLQVPVTNLIYTAGISGSPGILAVKNNNATVGTFRLAGNYTGKAFALSPSSISAGAYDITVQQTSGSAGTPSPGTNTPDSYVWNVNTGGAWNDAVDWKNLTTGANPAPVAPGLNNAVAIAGPVSGPAQTIFGPGNAASISVTGATTLDGRFNAGSIAIGTAAASGTLNLAAGTALAANTATLLYGPLTASGANTRLTISGALVLGGARTRSTYADSLLTASGGAAIRAGSLTLAPANAYGGITGQSRIVVDAASTLGIGNTDTTAPGTVTVDAGRSITGAGLVGGAAGIVDNGIIAAQGGELVLSGGVRGGGTLQVGAGATLTLASGSAATPIAFTGPAGALTVTASAGMLNASGVISGFASTDAIGIATQGLTVTAANYQPGYNGTSTLTVSAGGTVLGSLTLAGDFSYSSFAVDRRAGSASIYDITLRPLPPDPLFNIGYYLAHNADLAAIPGLNAYQHYMTTGWKEGRNPDALFDTRYYLSRNAALSASGANPLTDFINTGWREGRDPSAAFSNSDYLAANQDVKAAGIDPLRHYIQSGQSEGRMAFAVNPAPDPLVDATYYYAHNPDVRAAGVDASAHYLANGWYEGRNPNAYCDTRYYLAQNPDVSAAGLDPLLHYENNGRFEGRAPSLAFDGGKYLDANPDVRASGGEPLLHFLAEGQAEGRQAFLSGGAAPADPLVNADYYDRQLGATIIPTGDPAAQQAAWSYDAIGWQRGLNPDAWFDTAYYLNHNPDVAAAHVNPLAHYETHGWLEGRDASAQFSTRKYLAAYSDVNNANMDPLLHYVAHGRGEAGLPLRFEARLSPMRILEPLPHQPVQQSRAPTGRPGRMPIARLLVALHPRDIQVRPGRFVHEPPQEMRREARIRLHPPVATLPRVRDVAFQPLAIRRVQRHPPRPLPHRSARRGQVRRQHVICGEQSRHLMPERRHDTPRQRRQIHHRLRPEPLDRPRQRIRQNQPPLRVGVNNLDRRPRVHPQHVARPETVGADRVFRQRQHRDCGYRGLPPCQRQHRPGTRRRPCHVRPHLPKPVRRLDTDTPSVERDPLANEQHRLNPQRPRPPQHNQARRVSTSPPHRQKPLQPGLLQRLPFQHLYFDPMRLQRPQVCGKAGRRQLVAGLHHHVAGEQRPVNARLDNLPCRSRRSRLVHHHVDPRQQRPLRIRPRQEPAEPPRPQHGAGGQVRRVLRPPPPRIDRDVLHHPQPRDSKRARRLQIHAATDQQQPPLLRHHLRHRPGARPKSRPCRPARLARHRVHRHRHGPHRRVASGHEPDRDHPS